MLPVVKLLWLHEIGFRSWHGDRHITQSSLGKNMIRISTQPRALQQPLCSAQPLLLATRNLPGCLNPHCVCVNLHEKCGAEMSLILHLMPCFTHVPASLLILPSPRPHPISPPSSPHPHLASLQRLERQPSHGSHPSVPGQPVATLLLVSSQRRSHIKPALEGKPRISLCHLFRPVCLN